jgi:sec-independent protein translocase protein TatA
MTQLLYSPVLLAMIGTQEIIIIAVIILLLFGGRKIPELMRGLGKGIREFKDAKSDGKEDLEKNVKDR